MTKEALQKYGSHCPLSIEFYHKVLDKYGNEKLADMLTNMFTECATRLSEVEKISGVAIKLTLS